jgi:lipoate---protein ligase
MIGIVSNSNDPYENLAIEKYLLSKFKDNFLFIYQNQDCVIIGRNQIVSREINNEFISKEKIPIVRRLSGGGAVFNDLGNINYSFIVNRKPGTKRTKLFNYLVAKFVLREFDILIQIQNDNLFYNEKKLSGTAQYCKGKRQIHHGTFLVNSNIKKLKKCLDNFHYLKYKSNAQSSKKKIVTNLNKIINKSLNWDNIICLIKNYLLLGNINELISVDQKRISDIKLEIKSNNWLYNKEPHYSFDNNFKIKGKKINIHFEIKRNRITNFKSNIKFLNEKQFNGCHHNFESICEIVKDSNIAGFFF